MKLFVILFHIFVGVELMAAVLGVGRMHYDAISDDIVSYVHPLYQKERNTDPPSPSLDPAVADPSVRLQICEEISRSGVFKIYGKKAVEMDEETYEELQQPQYSDIFQQIYAPSSAREYNNPYTLLDFEVHRRTFAAHRVPRRKSEYVFMCLLRRIKTAGEHSGVRHSDLEDAAREDNNEDDFPMSITRESSNAEGAGSEHVGMVNARTENSDNEDDTSRWDFNLGGTETDSPSPPAESTNNQNGNEQRYDTALRNLNYYASPSSEEDSDLDIGALRSLLGIMRSGENIEAVDVYLDNEDEDMPTGFDADEMLDENDDPNDIIPFYVTKIFNPHCGLGAHRFVFTNEKEHSAMLAEGAAKVNSRRDFNVELHYLELRKRHDPVSNCSDDPVCRLNDSPELFRVCTMVLTSSFFKGKVTYPFEVMLQSWVLRKVAFKTEEGLVGAAGKSYQEFMVRCFAAKVSDGRIENYYISRAYNPNEVFVFTEDSMSNSFKMYLENVSTHVGLVHERYNFGDVEI